MKSAAKWRDEFCNHTIISVRGNIVEDFVKDIQKDAVKDILEAIDHAYTSGYSLSESELFLQNAAMQTRKAIQ